MCFPHKEDQAGSTPAVTTILLDIIMTLLYIALAAVIFFAGIVESRKRYSYEGSLAVGVASFVLAFVVIMVGLGK